MRRCLKLKNRLIAVSVFTLLVLSMFAGLIPQAKAQNLNLKQKYKYSIKYLNNMGKRQFE